VTASGEPDLSGARWRKPSRSNNIGNCMESACIPDAHLVRDSKNRCGPVLVFRTESFAGFLAALRKGRFRVG
jgi:hypothetical protein